ncbi:hypothetical protein os1_17200 [Comamonadaceae bacterium OS-1]|nr:hypothetical protein os1_17200 [Comamonadaceae bacterium OS-1]
MRLRRCPERRQSVATVDRDGSEWVAQAQEVMNLRHFTQIDVSGSTTPADILWAFGPPASVDRVMAWDGDIWVYFDPAGVVRRTQQGPDERFFRLLR